MTSMNCRCNWSDTAAINCAGVPMAPRCVWMRWSEQTRVQRWTHDGVTPHSACPKPTLPHSEPVKPGRRSAKWKCFASNPDNWWATLDKSKKNDSEQEIENVITLSASSLATLRDCSLKWFYEKKAGANLVRKNSATIGSIVHALAQGITTGQIEPNIESLQKIVPVNKFLIDFKMI